MNSEKNLELKVDSSVSKYLDKIPKRDKERILGVITALPFNPYAGDVEKMKGEDNVWRRRVGSYRIIYEIYPSMRLVHVLDVRRRTSSAY